VAAIIDIKDLTKTYEKRTVVDHLNLQIEQGEIFGLLGPNGAGKTTTLLMLTTLKPPTSGTALINGFDINKKPDKVRKSIGIVFQEPSTDEILTGYENLKLHGWLYDMPDDLLKERLADVLNLVKLTDRKNDRVKKYSGGMRRRLELARGLMHHPKVLFLDEPTLGLDPQSREGLWEYIEKLAAEKNMTIILTTHYMDEADRLCDRLAIMDNGKIVIMDTPKQLKANLGGDIIRLKAAHLDQERLKALPYVKKISPCDGELCLTVENASSHLQEILSLVGKVDSVEVRIPTLDDVFLHYTGKALKEANTQGTWGSGSMNAEADE
jgi:ABC-2 type transport system ATP-binding protein